MDGDEEVVTVGQELTGPGGLEVAVVIGVEATHGLPARQAENPLGRVPGSHDLNVADAPLDLQLRLQVVVGLAEVNVIVRPHYAQTAEVDELVTLDRGPAALVLPAAYLDDDVHLSMLTGGIGLSQGTAARQRRCRSQRHQKCAAPVEDRSPATVPARER